MRIQRSPALVRLARDAKGANLVEAAIISPTLMLVTFAIIKFATLLYVHEALQNGVSQATRFAITGRVISGQSRTESIKAVMRQATPTLTLPDGAFAFSHIPANGGGWVSGTGGPNSIERLTVTYSWPIMTPLLRPFFSTDAVVFTVESAMKNEGPPPS
jgi:Flp pilus assembly protein TadG